VSDRRSGGARMRAGRSHQLPRVGVRRPPLPGASDGCALRRQTAGESTLHRQRPSHLLSLQQPIRAHISTTASRARSQRSSRHASCRHAGSAEAVPRVVLMHGTTLRSVPACSSSAVRGHPEPAPCLGAGKGGSKWRTDTLGDPAPRSTRMAASAARQQRSTPSEPRGRANGGGSGSGSGGGSTSRSAAWSEGQPARLSDLISSSGPSEMAPGPAAAAPAAAAAAAATARSDGGSRGDGTRRSGGGRRERQQQQRSAAAADGGVRRSDPQRGRRAVGPIWEPLGSGASAPRGRPPLGRELKAARAVRRLRAPRIALRSAAPSSPCALPCGVQGPSAGHRTWRAFRSPERAPGPGVSLGNVREALRGSVLVGGRVSGLHPTAEPCGLALTGRPSATAPPAGTRSGELAWSVRRPLPEAQRAAGS
jgi:hypothetical protein